MARRDLCTPATPIDLIEGFRDGQLQLHGVPGASQLFGALLPPRDLQTKTLKAQRARRLEQLLIVEPVPRFLRSAPGAERLDASWSARQRLPLTACLRVPLIKIALPVVRQRKGFGSHVSSHESSGSTDHATA